LLNFLSVSDYGTKLILKREVSEIFVNNYNPFWMEADDDNLFSSTFNQFWGNEKIIRKFLGTNDGKCGKCQMYPSINDLRSIKVEVPDR
jgi:hypothetical protein